MAVNPELAPKIPLPQTEAELEQLGIIEQATDSESSAEAYLGRGIEIASDDELEASLASAVHGSGVTYELAGGDQARGTVHNRVILQEADIDTSKLSEHRQKMLKDGEIVGLVSDAKIEPFAKEGSLDTIYATEAEVAENSIKGAIARSVPELNLRTDEIFQNAMEKGGTLNQVIEFGFNNGNAISVANFGELEISADQQTELKSVFDRINQLSKGSLSQYSKRLFVLPHAMIQELQGRNELGDNFHTNAFARNGVVVLSDGLFASGKKNDKEYAGDTDAYISTVAHEYGHVLESHYIPGGQSYGEQLGWESHSYTLEDGSQHTIRGIGNKHQDNPEVKPTSWYGYTKAGEDFAEAFAAIVLDQPIDDVRRTAVLENVARGGSKEESDVAPSIDTIHAKDATNSGKFGLVPQDYKNHFKLRFAYEIVPDVSQEKTN